MVVGQYDHSTLPAHFLGLNSVNTAPESAVRSFVAEKYGHTVITSVLIANNGIAAVKEIRSVRCWAYQQFGNERAISFTVMATPEDLAANAEYIRMADQVVQVPGGTNNNNYANVDLIVDVAEQAGVQAVWAGWGHASENPTLPEALAASPKRIVFIGPPGSAMRSLGDKISSTIVAQHAKVPCIPWSGTGVDDVYLDEETGLVSVKDEVYAQGCVSDAEEALEKARAIGLPVMIKASEGGGGKGIRKVDDEKDFISLFHQVKSEIPGSPIFVMKLAGSARHLEVQLLADQYGNNISLFGRDCSVQRRHQKIIEEAPVESNVAPTATFEEMEKAAVRLGRLVGYASAGTVEYLYSAEDDKFYFLELNPRLQVEHPTTEMVSNVNLPAAQLQIAMGIPLDFITDIRMMYGADPLSDRPLNFDGSRPELDQYQRRPKPHGHTTACRITSEDPGEGFKPSGGVLSELNFRSSKNVWGYFSVSSSGNIHSFSDSQFGHVFAFGDTREESRRSMIVALKELSIRGDFRTTVEYLISLLESEAFEKNEITTSWLDGLIAKKVSTAEKPDPIVAILSGAATRSCVEATATMREYKAALERGQAPPKDMLKSLNEIDFIYDGEHYRFTTTQAGPITVRVFLNGSRVDVGVRSLTDGGFLVSIDGKTHVAYYQSESAGGTRLNIDGKTCHLEVENDPTQLRTPSPGKLVRFLVEAGDHISSGQPYAEVEVMKMFMPLVAQEDGIVQPVKQPGSQLVAGDILGILALDDPSKVKHAKTHDGQLPAYGPPRMISSKLDQQFAAKYEVLQNIMAGYDNRVVLSATFRQLIETLRDPRLPYVQWNSRFSALHSRLPPGFDSTLREIVDRAGNKHAEFPSKQLLKAITKSTPTNSSDLQMWEELIEPLRTIAQEYSYGIKGHELQVAANLLAEYYDVEKLFSGEREEDVILKLREAHKDELDRVIAISLSHFHYGNKEDLVMMILGEYTEDASSSSMVAQYLRPVLKSIVELDDTTYSKVVLKAREVLIKCSLPSLEEQRDQMEHVLRSSVMGSAYGSVVDRQRTIPNSEVLKQLWASKFSVFDVLFQFFRHPDMYVVGAAMEVYARRINRAARIENLQHHLSDQSIPSVTYDFEPTELSSPYVTFSDTADGSLRHGIVCPADYEELDEAVLRVVQLLPRSQRRRRSSDTTLPNSIVELGNTVNLVIFSDPNEFDTSLSDEEISEYLQQVVQEQKDQLFCCSVRRLTVMIQIGVGTKPKYFTYQGPDYQENKMLRHVNPPLAFELELSRLSNFEITPVFRGNRLIHMFEAHARSDPADKRFFVRTTISPERLAANQEVSTLEYMLSEAHKLINDVVDLLEATDTSGSDLNHIFVNFTAVFNLDYDVLKRVFQDFVDTFGRRLWRLRVESAEIRLLAKDSSKPDQVIPVRAIVGNVSGFVATTDFYTEVRVDSGEWVYKTITGKPGNLHMTPLRTPYPTKESLQLRRYEAHVKGTSFVYDYPALFEGAVNASWQDASLDVPSNSFNAAELILDENNSVTEVQREPGANSCGMVAWICTAKTRECPHGRKFILIANDITYKIGSFGPSEDSFFNLVTEFARSQGLPRIYAAANSGARLGIAEELLPYIRVEWRDEQNPDLGFEYLYLDPEDYEHLSDETISCTRVVENGKVRYRINYVVGTSEGLGVESLRGSGLIAGATSRAYKDIFTATLVTCRSVGIGAYLVRLGQRAIQVEGKPLLLTGAEAINKLLARKVYSSNLQLGGTQIMYKNGVSHLVAQDDYDSVAKVMNWLAYVPSYRDGPLPILVNPTDPWDRDVEFAPVRDQVYDVRELIAGSETERGLFDQGSWVETLGGWARGVVTGRARLGGIPFGVIGVETRPTESIYPADPANPSSTEQVIGEAGQVWYPNSAYKTAQAIQDFTNGEQLPIMILANWRGFSGGQRDMFFEVLKYGSYIVDALTECRRPVFVYIPPLGELRGGSWVVVDPTINPKYMEMYCDTDARAGVLEPEGLVGVRMRRPKLLAMMQRLDRSYADLCEKEADALTGEDPELQQIRATRMKREDQLLPVYHQIAVQFAELHDRPGRMKSKGCINGIVSWANARRFFYWRALRRLEEVSIAAKGVDPVDVIPSELTTDREIAEWFHNSGDEVARAISVAKAAKSAATISEAIADIDLAELAKFLSAEARASLASLK